MPDPESPASPPGAEPADARHGAALTALAHLDAALAALRSAGLPSPPAADPVISHKAAAAQIGLSERTLHRICALGDGPPRVRLSARRIGYRMSALKGWAERRQLEG